MSKRLKLLKENMIKKGFDAFLVPRGDMFSGEEVPKSEERLKYISKFSGSAGYGIISSNPGVKSAIFSDGRYQLQMKKEIDINHFDIFEGGKLPENKKSIAIKVTLQPQEKTFTDKEIEKISTNIIDLISKSFEGELRQQ